MTHKKHIAHEEEVAHEEREEWKKKTMQKWQQEEADEEGRLPFITKLKMKALEVDCIPEVFLQNEKEQVKWLSSYT